MSKMGRYVFQLQEETEQYEYRNRERCTHAGEDETTRPAVRRHGHRRFFFGAGGDGEPLRQRVTRFQKHHPPKKFSVVQDGEAMRVFRVI